MTLDLDSVIVAMMALMVLLLVAGAEGMWRRRGRRAMADEPRPTSGTDLMTAIIHQARRHLIGRQWSGVQSLEHVPRLPRSPEAGLERGIIKIVAVYRTDPVMVVGETAEALSWNAPSTNSPTCPSSSPRGSGRSSWSSIASFRSGEGSHGLIVPTVRPTAEGSRVTCFRLAWAPLCPGPIPILG
jgi:hypothetical protein